MTREQKTQAVEEITAMLQKAGTVYLTDYSGLTVEQTNKLRGKLRDGNVDYHVLKNTLVRIAMERLGGYDEVLSHLVGPTAVAFSEDPSAPARILKDFLKQSDLGKPALKAAFIEGAVFGGDQLDALASLKSKEELVADVVALLLSPINTVVGALQAQGGNIVGALKTLAEREN